MPSTNLTLHSSVRPDLLALWTRVCDPQGIGMAEAMAVDIAGYTKEPPNQVLERMANAKAEFKRLWQEAQVDDTDPRSVSAFYHDQFVEAYELANWHCGRENGVPPLHYAYAAQFAQQKGFKRVLDFGSGIGTGSLCFASVGCEVHAADIATQLLDFVGYRFRHRGLQPILINLSTGQTPQTNYYDLITCFDVLEHVPDQLGKLRELRSYLRNGGYLLVNLMADSHDDDRPMHISSAGDVLSLIRKSNLVPEWGSGFGQVSVLVRKPYARLYNYAASWVDWMQGS